MGSSDRVSGAVTTILDAIISGRFTTEQPLPPENDLAAFLEVSRPTMREAVRTLSSQGVLQVRHGSGTYVRPMSQWRDITVIVYVMTRTQSPRTLGVKLIEVRRMIEVGASGLAAAHRSDADLDELKSLLVAFDEASERDDVDALAAADLAIHDAILSAAGNPFLPAIMHSLKDALTESRRHTSADRRIREHGHHFHRELVEAIEDRDVERAKDVMRAHMTQTRRDIMEWLSEK